MKLFIEDHHCPGDTLEDTAVVRDLVASNPGIQVNVETTAQELWANNPHLDRSVTRQNADKCLKFEMPLINQCNQNGLHVVDCLREDMQDKTGLRIKPGPRRADIHLSADERADLSLWRNNGIPLDRPYWILNAGYKDDTPCKHWGTVNFQHVVELTAGKVVWVQIGGGEKTHSHAPIPGAIDMRGKTTHRQFALLMFRAAGCLTGISYAMHMATIQWDGHGDRPRPCVVIGGGREPMSFTLYPNHHWHTAVGTLDCCRAGGCWNNARVKGDEKDRRPCRHPVAPQGDRLGETVGQCMASISPFAVRDTIMSLLEVRP